MFSSSHSPSLSKHCSHRPLNTLASCFHNCCLCGVFEVRNDNTKGCPCSLMLKRSVASASTPSAASAQRLGARRLGMERPGRAAPMHTDPLAGPPGETRPPGQPPAESPDTPDTRAVGRPEGHTCPVFMHPPPIRFQNCNVCVRRCGSSAGGAFAQLSAAGSTGSLLQSLPE